MTVIPSGDYSFKKIKDPLHKPTYNLPIDIRDVNYTPVVSKIFAISEFVISFKRIFKEKTAIVAKGEILYNMFIFSAMFVVKQGLDTYIFHNQEEALAWIADPDSIKVH